MGLPTDRRGVSHGRQQQRRGHGDRAAGAVPGPRGRHLARPAHRDRRQLPHPGDHGRQRGDAPRGRHHQHHPDRRLRGRDWPEHRPADAGPHQQLPRPRVHQVRRPAVARGPRPQAQPDRDRRRRQRAGDRPGPVRVARRAAGVGQHRRGCGPGAVQRRQAARRPAGGYRRRQEVVDSEDREGPADARTALRQDDPGRAGGDVAVVPQRDAGARRDPRATYVVRAAGGAAPASRGACRAAAHHRHVTNRPSARGQGLRGRRLAAGSGDEDVGRGNPGP